MRPIPKKKNILTVNEVYKEQNPSIFFRSPNKKKIYQFFQTKNKFLIEKLKLLPKMFKNSELLDLGCGSGQNTISYDWAGAKCTLVDYDKNSTYLAKKLFNKYAKNKFKIINKDLFNFKSKKKFDFVISNAVAHHTSDTIKSIEHAISFLKKDGILILGLGETNGFFQRNLQRYILYSLSEDKNEIIKLAKIFFSENLKRAKKYGGRKIIEIIYDTYINPRIDPLSFQEIKKLFKKNKLHIFSSDEENFDYIETGKIKKYYYSRLTKISSRKDENIEGQSFLFNALMNFSSLEISDKIKKKNSKTFKEIFNIQNKLTKIIKNQNFQEYKKLKIDTFLKNYKKAVVQLKKTDVIDKKKILIFLGEISKILNILNRKNNRIDKINKLKVIIKKNKFLFKGRSGKGMNYYVGLKV